MVQSQGSKEPDVGDDLGVYHLEALAGEGGMGRVYRAVHGKLGRKVALKLLRRRYAGNPDAIARFFQEARAVNVIRHPNIVEITDFVEGAGGDSYYIMEWLDGESLDARLKRQGTLPTDEVIAIGAQVASALDAAHKAGFVHRDLKPENIYLVDRGGLKVKILDFGVALLQGTSDGAVAGTPVYMSPEIAAGRAVDGRSDIYSLGVVLYQLCAGAPPFSADSLSGYVMKHMTARPRKLHDVAPKLPLALATTVDRCLEKEPEARFASMGVLERALTASAGRPEAARARPVRGIVAVALGMAGLAVPLYWAAHRRASATDTQPPAVIAPPVAPPAPAEPERIEIPIASEPSGAEVFHDGALLGVTPCAVRLSRGYATVELKHPGFHDAARSIDAQPGTRLSVQLEPIPTKRPHGKKLSRGGTINPFEK
jgi:serine/threonine-protein kinase